MWFVTDYYIVRCNGCDSQKFASVYKSSEDTGYKGEPFGDDYEEFLIETVKEYPSINVSYEKPQSYFSAPFDLRQIHDETYNALCFDARKLASIGMRSIIEVICALNNVTDDIAYSLPEKIKILRTKQIISTTMESVLLSVKEFGDQSAHTLRVPTLEELKVGWDAVGILMAAIYGAEDGKNNAARLKGFKKRVKNKESQSD